MKSKTRGLYICLTTVLSGTIAGCGLQGGEVSTTAAETTTAAEAESSAAAVTFAAETESPDKFGNWEIVAQKDKFGDYTGDYYLVNPVNGTFSNSATSGSDLIASVFYDDGYDGTNLSFYFKLLEYGSHVSSGHSDQFELDYKRPDGSTWTYQFPNVDFNDEFYFVEPNSNVTQMFCEDLEAGGTIKCVISDPKYGSTYNFNIDGTGFSDAVAALNEKISGSSTSMASTAAVQTTEAQ